MAELAIAFFVNAGGIIAETLIARDIAGIELCDLGPERWLVIGIVEIRAVAPVEPVEGRHWQQGDILRHVMP